MKKITLANYATDKYYLKIVKAVDNELKFQNFVAPIRVFVSMGLLEAQDIDNWRKGRVPYLERVVKCNLAKAGRILRILRFHAGDLREAQREIGNESVLDFRFKNQNEKGIC